MTLRSAARLLLLGSLALGVSSCCDDHQVDMPDTSAPQDTACHPADTTRADSVPQDTTRHNGNGNGGGVGIDDSFGDTTDISFMPQRAEARQSSHGL